MFAAATKQKSFSKPRGKSLKSQRATVDAVKTLKKRRRRDWCWCCCCWQLSQHRVAVIVSAVFISLTPPHRLRPSAKRCSQSDKTENVVGPATPIFNVRDLTRKEDEGGGGMEEELGSFQSRGIGIGIGCVQLLELPCTYLHWATTVN